MCHHPSMVSLCHHCWWHIVNNTTAAAAEEEAAQKHYHQFLTLAHFIGVDLLALNGDKTTGGNLVGKDGGSGGTITGLVVGVIGNLACRRNTHQQKDRQGKLE